jgi:hypothetical protein
MKQELELEDIVYTWSDRADADKIDIVGFKVTTKNFEIINREYNTRFFKSYCVARDIIMEELSEKSKKLIETRKHLMKSKKKQALVIGDF